MDVALLALDELTAAPIEAWNELAERTVEPNPFFEPLFLLPALEHLDRSRSVRLLVITDESSWNLVLPVIPATRWRGIPVPALLAWRHPYSVLGTPLVDREAARPTLERLFVYLRFEISPARFSVLEWFGHGPTLETLRTVAAPEHLVTFSSFERPVLRRRGDNDYLSVLSRHRRKELARRRRQLEAELGAVRVVDRAAEDEARRRFVTLEAAGWKGDAGTALGSARADTEFFYDMTAGFAAAGRLELASLETDDGAVLAMATRLLVGEGVFQLKITYDEDFRRFGPGRVLDVALLESFHDHPDQQWVDSCTDPSNDFKAALYPDRRCLETVIVPAAGRLNLAIAANLPRARRWRQRLSAEASKLRGRRDGTTKAAGAGASGSPLGAQRGTRRAPVRVDDAAPRSSSRLRVDVVPLTSLPPATTQAWDDLAARAVEPNPFFAPAFAVPAARHLEGGAQADLVCVFDGSELVFAMPIRWDQRWRRLRLPVVTSWCHTHCFLGAPLVVGDDRAEAIWRFVLDALAQGPPTARVLVLELLPTDGALLGMLERAAHGRRVACYEQYDRAALQRRSLSGDTAPLRGRRRRELERRSRQVEAITGAPFTTVDVAGDRGAVEAFLALEVASWAGRAGTALGSQAGSTAFALEAARCLEERNQLVLLSTCAGTGLAAGLFAIRDRGGLFMFKIAYDEQLAKFSPGTQLVHDMMHWFAQDEQLEWIDSCAHPETEFINRLLPDRRPFATVLIALDHGVGALMTEALPHLVSWRRRVQGRRP
jgi:CelD/BcsL family acetyltransferase involved in cellulose biosynthesis